MKRRRWWVTAGALSGAAALAAVIAWQRTASAPAPPGPVPSPDVPVPVVPVAVPVAEAAAVPAVTAAPPDRVRGYLGRLGYARARALLVAAGVVVLLAIALVVWLRRVETVEVLATLLFVPVFLAALFWKVRGGLAAGLLAAAVYVWARTPAIHAAGAGRFAPTLVSRSLSLVAFGVVAGWSSHQLALSLEKLELYDDIDDETGLFNARFLLRDLDLETARATRYRTFFSVAAVSFPADRLAGLARRQRAALLGDIGRLLHSSARTVDRVVHAHDAARHHVAVVLPETGAEGAAIFATRLAERLAETLRQRGVAIDDADMTVEHLTVPGDEGGLATLRATYAAIDRTERPDA